MPSGPAVPRQVTQLRPLSASQHAQGARPRCLCPASGAVGADVAAAVQALLSQARHVRGLPEDDAYRRLWQDNRRRLVHWLDAHALD